ncbi:MAB_1171c family putative transporter [Kitasatospora sp. NPDC059722]|uniref:MAB_1171c family putative transporter n=1 Tax=Kitasatospora sp. NPDC059722 TaxID=3346925 RepID=UPI0036B489A4
MSELALYPVAAFFALNAYHLARSTRAARNARSPRDGARGGWAGLGASTRYTCYCTAFLGAALLLLAPPTVTGAARLLSLAGLLASPALLPVLLGDALHLCATGAIALLTVALASGEPARTAVRRQLGVLGTVLALCAVLITAAGPDVTTGDLTVAPAGRPYLAAYNGLRTLYIAYCLTALLRQVARRARATARGHRRTGLHLLTLGLAVGLVWDAWGIDDVVDAATSGAQSAGEDSASAVLGLLCAALLAAGLSTTLWPAVLTPVRGWLRAHRRYRALTPLWTELHTVLPQIALVPAHRLLPRRLLPPRDPQFALYRRIIEIHDARLILRHHLDPRTPQWLTAAARRFPPPAALVAATAEAAALAAALERAAAGALPTPAAPLAVPPAEPPCAALESEADRLVDLARVYATSPAVAAVRTYARTARPNAPLP